MRSLSLHERYSIARVNLGFPHAITVLVEYPSQQDMPDRQFLAHRIRELQEHFPLLYAELRDTKTKRPYFEQGGSIWHEDDVVYQDETSGVDRTSVLRLANQRMEKASTSLWQIGLHVSDNSSLAFLTVSVNHVLMDGRGLFNFLFALLASDISMLPYETVDTLPRLDDTMDLRPGIVFIAGLIWTELLVPKLPAFLQSYLVGTQAWPVGKVAVDPSRCDDPMSTVELPLQLMQDLKISGRDHGVKTLHPILKVAYGVAMWHVLGEESLRLQTPITMRSSEFQHGHCTGNYTGVFEIGITAGVERSFWHVAASIGDYMTSSTGRKRALEYMGALAYIPDPEIDQAARDTARPTGWEQFLGEKLDRKIAPSCSMNISNIGFIRLPTGATDMLWMQSASPVGSPLEINVVSHEGGMRATTVWREGAMVDHIQVGQITNTWVRILERLAASKDWTMGDLVAEEL